jgi:YVTN family beta-propeller protein
LLPRESAIVPASFISPGDVSVIDPSTFKTTATIGTGASPYDIAVVPPTSG